MFKAVQRFIKWDAIPVYFEHYLSLEGPESIPVWDACRGHLRNHLFKEKRRDPQQTDISVKARPALAATKRRCTQVFCRSVKKGKA